MSDPAHEENHEGPIKTPKQLVVAVIASFVIPIVVILLIAKFVAAGTKSAAGSTELDAQAVAKRLAPAGSVEVRDASAPQVLRSGEQVFAGVCGACHTTGAAGAPKPGDTAAWAPRLKQGYEALVTAALKGKGAMPPQAGGEYSDVEIARAVVYIANQSGATFEEPQAAAAPPASAASN